MQPLKGGEPITGNSFPDWLEVTWEFINDFCQNNLMKVYKLFINLCNEISISVRTNLFRTLVIGQSVSWRIKRGRIQSFSSTLDTVLRRLILSENLDDLKEVRKNFLVQFWLRDIFSKKKLRQPNNQFAIENL